MFGYMSQLIKAREQQLRQERVAFEMHRPRYESEK